MKRFAYRWLAYISATLGAIGVFLPLVPTTPFILVAVWAGFRGSPRFARWLVAHPRFGPLVRNWHRHRAISAGAKRAALLMLLISLAVVWVTIPLLPVQLSITVLLAGTAVFIASRRAAPLVPLTPRPDLKDT